MISFAFATAVVATVYALGHISGNHINPAVTLGLAVTGKFQWSRVPPTWAHSSSARATLVSRTRADRVVTTATVDAAATPVPAGA